MPPLLLLAGCADDLTGDEPAPSPGAAITATAPPGTTARAADFVAGEVIVKAHTPIDGTTAVVIAGQRLAPITQLPSGAWLMRIEDVHRRGPAAADLAAATLDTVDALAADPGVEFAHENARLELSLTPNDPLYPLQWHWAPGRVPQAWDRTVGSSAIRLAIIDTGRNNHPDLAGRWDPGYDFVDGDTNPTDTGTWAHGIHVAGIAGAASNNSGGGAGVCWNCRLISLRVTPTVAQIEQAVAWAAGTSAATRRADVVNMSFNDPGVTSCGTYPGVQAAIQTATANGVSVVASAGNQFATNGPRFPATCPGTIAVAASAPGAAIAPYSNRGPGTDLVAPGGGLFNNDPQFGFYGQGISCPPPTPGGPDPWAGTVGVLATWTHAGGHCHRYLSGTSMAAPYVAGVIGLMRSVRPALTPAEIEQLLAATAQPMPGCSPAGACGAGHIDADAAVLAAQNGLGPEITVAPASVAFGNQPVGTTSGPIAVVISNTGMSALSWSAFVGNGFTLDCAGPCSGSIPPAANRTVNVRFAPTSAGTWSGALTIQSNDADEPTVAVTLSGAGVAPAIAVNPTSLDFGTSVVGNATVSGITVTNPGTSPLTLAAISAPPGFAISGTYPVAVAPGASRFVPITCVRAAAGSFWGNAVITHDAGAPTPIALSCYSAPGTLVVEEPASGEFVLHPGASTTVRVRNQGPGPVNIGYIAFGDEPDSWFAATDVDVPTELAAGEALTWTVTCTPPPVVIGPGLHTAKHYVKTNAWVPGGSISAGCYPWP